MDQVKEFKDDHLSLLDAKLEQARDVVQQQLVRPFPAAVNLFATICTPWLRVLSLCSLPDSLNNPYRSTGEKQVTAAKLLRDLFLGVD